MSKVPASRKLRRDESGYVLNAAGIYINPATEEKQDTIISQQTDGSQVTKVKNAAGTTINPATEGKQDTAISNQTSGAHKTQITDDQGNAVSLYAKESGGYAIDIHDADVHTRLFNHYFEQNTGDVDTLASQASKGATAITLNDATGFTAGNWVDINQGATHIHYYRKMTNVVGNVLTLDAPLDFDIASGSTVKEVVFDMSVSGTLGSPSIYTVPVSAGEVIHITSFLIQIVCSSAPADDLFGNLAAITNGVHVRIKRNNGADDYKTITNWKANKDMKEDMYDITYTDKAGGANHGVNGRWTLTARMGIIRLDGDNDDSLEILIQDNLSTLVDFQIKTQGHFE